MALELYSGTLPNPHSDESSVRKRHIENASPNTKMLSELEECFNSPRWREGFWIANYTAANELTSFLLLRLREDIDTLRAAVTTKALESKRTPRANQKAYTKLKEDIRKFEGERIAKLIKGSKGRVEGVKNKPRINKKDFICALEKAILEINTQDKATTRNIVFTKMKKILGRDEIFSLETFDRKLRSYYGKDMKWQDIVAEILTSKVKNK